MNKNLVICLTTLFLSSAQAGTLYIGADVGASKISSSINNEVSSKTGVSADIKSFYNADLGSMLNSDIGLGYLYNKSKGSANNTDVTITTKLVYLDLDLKYNIGSQLSVGPVINYFTGTNTDFSEVEQGSNSNMLAGLKLAYKIGSDKQNPMRFDARVISSTDNAKTLFALIGFSFGFDMSSSNSEKSQSMTKAEIMPPLTEDEEKPDLTLTLKSARVLFDTNVYELDSELDLKIKKLAKYLMQNEGEWARLVISGHTDIRGTREYNLQLSKNRAESVSQAFIMAGIPQNRIASKGYGFDRPLDKRMTDAALEKNRRTEIEFYGIKHPERFNQALIDILK